MTGLGLPARLLSEEIARSNAETSNSDLSLGPQVAYGEITDARRTEALSGILALAVSCGESGQILRILRLTEQQAELGKREDVLLSLWKMTPSGSEDEVFWNRSAAPIRRIKFATDLNGSIPARWLIVQKQTSTTILRPTYHRVPVPVSGAALQNQASSRLDPTEICSISTRQTGGSSHVDVAFNPRAHGNPAQFAIVDECGYWSIWEVPGKVTVIGHAFSPKLVLCGHFERGLVASLTSQPRLEVGFFGVLFCPEQERFPGDWNDKMHQPESMDAPENDIPDEIKSTPRAQSLLIWNRTRLELLNSKDGSRLQSFPFGLPRKANREILLDVKLNPADPTQALILTTQFLYWMDFSSVGGQSSAAPEMTLRKLPHHHPNDRTVRMCTSYEAGGESYTCVTFLHSKFTDTVDVYWLFNFPGNSNIAVPEFHHEVHILDRPAGGEGSDKWHTLTVIPLRLRPKRKRQEGQRRGYYDLGVPLCIQFYQLLAMGKRLSLAHSICATATDPDNGALPTKTPVGKVRDFRDNPMPQRKAYLRYIEEKFVLPDKMENFLSLVHGPAQERGDKSLEFKALPSLVEKPVVTRRFRLDLLNKYLNPDESEEEGMASEELTERQREKQPEGATSFAIDSKRRIAQRAPHPVISKWDKAFDDKYVTFLAQESLDRQEAIMSKKARRRERMQKQADEYQDLMSGLPSSQPILSSIPFRIRDSTGPPSSQPFISSQPFTSSQPSISSQPIISSSQPVFGSSQGLPKKRRRMGIR